MHIHGLILNDFINFREAGITQLEASFDSSVHMFLGTNGSGKSSLLSQLSLFPTVKSRFGDEGFRELLVEKDGHTYRLTSDYSKSSSPHAFYVDDNPENVNAGGTTNIQMELIEERIGITPLINKLIMNQIPIASKEWTGAVRKHFFMDINPDKIGFVWDLHKTVSQKIRAAKSVLQRLNTRKVVLEQDMLSDIALNAIIEERDHIAKELTFLQKTLMTLGIGMGSLPEDPSPTWSDRDERIRFLIDKLRSCHRSVGQFSEVEPDPVIREQLQAQLTHEVASLDGTIRSEISRLEDLTQDLTKLQTAYAALPPDGERDVIDGEIALVEKERSLISSRPPVKMYHEGDLKTLEELLPQLTTHLQKFDGCPYVLLDNEALAKIRRKRESGQMRKESLIERLRDVENDMEKLQRADAITRDDLPKSNCAQTQCPLFNQFMEGYLDRESKYKQLSNIHERFSHKLKWVRKLIYAAQHKLNVLGPYNSELSEIAYLAKQCAPIMDVFRQDDILTTLQTHPFSLVTKLNDVLMENRQYRRYQELTDRLSGLYATKSRYVASGTHESTDLIQRINDMEKTHTALSDRISGYEAKKEELQNKLVNITQFENLRKSVTHLETAVKVFQDSVDIREERRRLNQLNEKTKRLQSDFLSRLGEIENLIRQQELIKARYNEEVIGEINSVTRELTELVATEKCLAVIPKDNIMSFNNEIIAQMNLLIEMIWTVPLQIDLVTYDNVLDYRFPFHGDIAPTPDISDGSEGQEELFNLVFNLALRIVLDLRGLPLCLDEVGRTFDEKHKERLLSLLKCLLDDGTISQLFIVNHHATIHEGFPHAQVLVLREDNIVLPPVYNEHVSII